MPTAAISKFYAQEVHQADHVVFCDRDYTPFKKIPLWIIKALKSTEAKILDLNCGTGLSSHEFFKQDYEVFGIDNSPEKIYEAHKEPFKQLICQSLEGPLPFKEGSFDGAVLLGNMEFIKNPTALFEEVSKALREGGFFGLTIPKKLPRAIEQKFEIYNYYKKDIEPLFREAGFHIYCVEEFLGFVSENESVHYYGYLLKKKTR